MMHLNGIMASVGAAEDPVTPSPRLVKAAHQFEASMLQELLKPMQEHSGIADKDDDEDDDSSDSNSALREYGTEIMAQALSERGGLGIAKMVLTKLAPLEAEDERAKAAVLRKS